jgi:DNA-binding NarL/FixJ family response regulator
MTVIDLMDCNLSIDTRKSFDWVEPGVHITNRELEVLELLSKGHTSKEIAQELFVSTHTIESHKKNLIHKMESKNAIDLVVKAIRLSIITV